MVTYNLKGKEKDSKKYYDVANNISKKIINNVIITGEDFLLDYMKYIKDNEIESVRTIEEYSLEILLIGVLISEYMNNGRAFEGKSVKIFVALNGLRNTNEKLKPCIDKIRGELIYKILKKQKGGESAHTLYDFYLVIRWMEAVGDFEEELKRLKGWYEFLKSEDQELVEEFFIYCKEITRWMYKVCKDEFENYLGNVEKYLFLYEKEHKEKEDFIFCGRGKIQYYLNIIGANIMNEVYKGEFIKSKEKRVYVPACMKINVNSCQSIRTTEGYKCMKCNKKCSVNYLMEFGESKGFKTMIIPHQTTLFNIGGKEDVGVIGVACILNLLSGGWKALRMGFKPQCVPLEYCGCSQHWCKEDIPTEINYTILKERLSISK